MWSRKELKERAKAVLKTNYWVAFWVSIVIALAGGNNGGSSGNSSGGNSDYSDSILPFGPSDSIFLDESFILLMVLGLVILVFALRIFLGYTLEVGGRRYFVKSAQYEDNKKSFTYAFQGENYLGIVSTMLLKGVQNFLWYLLFFIPGVIKSYSYRMVPYILADNPNIGSKRAIALSNEMTKGHKFDMFILDLSFIGWYLLGLLAFIVGMLFVMPYENATKAELYLVLRKNAIDNGWCSCEDLLLNYESLDDGMGLL